LQLVSAAVQVGATGVAMGHSTPHHSHPEGAGWSGLAKAHELQPVEIELLMSCKVVEIDEEWQVNMIRSMLEEAYSGNNSVRITELLCSLVRAQFASGVRTSPLEDVTLRIALECEERVSQSMGSCVRLARVLACKLDALCQLSQIYAE
tara:strand:+ start:306 stop:752 length:447 start_codon:yes stop_codon:yes gene_type:complete